MSFDRQTSGVQASARYWQGWERETPGGWRASIGAAELQARLEPARQAGTTLDLVCGKHGCGRVLDRLAPNEFPIVRSMWGHWPETRERAKAVRDMRRTRLDWRSRADMSAPSIRRSPSVQRGAGVERGCHPKCGANWQLREERLAEAFVVAFEAGRRQIVAGVDL